MTVPGSEPALEAATHWLDVHASEVNSLNVFPVPDGDTGTNMLLTMRAAVAAMSGESSTSATAIAALMVRRADGCPGQQRGYPLPDPPGICRRDRGRCLRRARSGRGTPNASEVAYRAVSRPLEGTILTVIREAAEAAEAADGDLVDVLERAVRAAHAAVQRTPTLLPVLRDAGVVDAGGQGLYLLMDGALRFVHGEVLPATLDELPSNPVEATVAVHRTTFAGHADGFAAMPITGTAPSF